MTDVQRRSVIERYHGRSAWFAIGLILNIGIWVANLVDRQRQRHREVPWSISMVCNWFDIEYRAFGRKPGG